MIKSKTELTGPKVIIKLRMNLISQRRGFSTSSRSTLFDASVGGFPFNDRVQSTDTTSYSLLKGYFKIHFFLSTPITLSQDFYIYLVSFLFEKEINFQIINRTHRGMVD
jgi:hypothetical protein